MRIDEGGWQAADEKSLPGVDLVRFRPRPRPAELVAKYGIQPDETVVGFLGSMSLEAGALAFVEVAHQLTELRNLRCIMAGDGPQLRLVKAAVASLSKRIRIEYLGALDGADMPAHLNLTDLVVVPSRVGGLPRIIMESMASGVPVVATPVGSIPQMIADGENGRVLEGQIHALAIAVGELVLDRAARERLGRNARQTAEILFRPEAANDSVERLLVAAGDRAASADPVVLARRA
jgi:glycosyltransferase involved in cell wall biosynthesis